MYNKNNLQRTRRSSVSSCACDISPRYTERCPEPRQVTATEPSLAMVYSISQRWQFINDGTEGFNRGTVFDELYKPFFGDKCKNGGVCK